MKAPTVITEGFRAFFLLAAMFAIFALAIWEGWLGVHAAGGMVVDTPFDKAPHLWHGHEMVFGYGSAVLGGFFLTALPGWTGAPAARTLFVSAAAALWIAGRLAVWFSGGLDPALVAVIDLAFLPLLGLKIGANLLRRPKPQNVVLLGVLAMLWAGNLMVHLEWMGIMEEGVSPGLRLGLSALCVLIAIIGGRVTPAFTRNAMRREGIESGLPVSRAIFERMAILGAAALGPLWAIGAPAGLLSTVAFATGAAQIARVAGWAPRFALTQPILWSLHLGMAMIGLGWLALGGGWAGLDIGESPGLHLLAIGGVGGMTLAMMSRAALGHTGRELRVAGAVALAYLLIALAAVLRFSGPVFAPAHYNTAILTGGALWLAAFTIFLGVYWPVLTGERAT